MKEVHLILADGTIFSGQSFGYEGRASGEVVFNTSMMGYQEILTDPSYSGQIVVMTYTQIGNYGINQSDVESHKLFLSGFVVKEVSPIVSNFRAKKGWDLSLYLKKNKVPGIQGIDTRALVKHIRDKGAMQAMIVVGPLKNQAQAIKKVQKLPSMEGQNLAEGVSCKKPWIADRKERSAIGDQRFTVIAYDFGIKQNILRMLIDHGCQVKVVPYNTSADVVLKQNPDGIFLSNGPGDPAACGEAIESVKQLLGKKPVFGICLGHQILGLALGAKTFKLKFGHHGGNQPVMDLSTRKVEITAQNHGFAVDDKSLPREVEVTHINLNDKTVEGLAHKKLKAFSVQYHPEASPGPHDSHYLFERFVQLMSDRSDLSDLSD